MLIGDDFGKKIAKGLDIAFMAFEDRVFTDGELCPNILFEAAPKKDSEVILAMNKHSTESINDYTLKAYFMAKTLHDMNLKVKLVFPYYSYARQDKVFRPGEPLSSTHVAQMFDPIITDFITVTAHLQRRTSIAPLFNHAKAHNVSGIPALVRELPEIENPYILGPDTESIHWAKEMAEIMNVPDYGAFTKTRDVNTGAIKVSTGTIELKGRNVLIVDDMVSTGGTMLKGIELARKVGAQSVHVSFVHPILAGGALE
ncbi:MAG: ribose-phosphate diphosphokinase, partial [Candidatus Altiarchaeota archaeon]|nr:ribose-phosphate diphosphokinase [Candidatus Altiarchaeota archaeon]